MLSSDRWAFGFPSNAPRPRALPGLARIATLTALLWLAVVFQGCADQPPALDGRELEETLIAEMNGRLDDLTVDEVDCVYLTRDLTRCFARTSASEGPFRLPVSVRRRASSMTWSVAEDDLAAARRGGDGRTLRAGERVVVEGRDGERVQVRVLEPIDPLEVTYPQVPPEYGHRYVAVPIQLRNRGDKPYADDLRSRLTGTLSDGSLLTPVTLTGGKCASSRLGRIRLEPGDRTAGCVVFEVPNRQDLVSVAVQLGYSDSILEWALEEAPPAT